MPNLSAMPQCKVFHAPGNKMRTKVAGKPLPTLIWDYGLGFILRASEAVHNCLWYLPSLKAIFPPAGSGLPDWRADGLPLVVADQGSKGWSAPALRRRRARPSESYRDCFCILAY